MRRLLSLYPADGTDAQNCESYLRETTMPQSNHHPSTPETGKQVQARPHDSVRLTRPLTNSTPRPSRYGTPPKIRLPAVAPAISKKRQYLTGPVPLRESDGKETTGPDRRKRAMSIIEFSDLVKLPRAFGVLVGQCFAPKVMGFVSMAFQPMKS